MANNIRACVYCLSLEWAREQEKLIGDFLRALEPSSLPPCHHLLSASEATSISYNGLKLFALTLAFSLSVGL